MSARLQTWFPFTFHVYTNGRERLARQMDMAGLQYRRQGNCFPSMRKLPMEYYWTVFQSEWAMDLVFDAERLRRLYPQLIHLGMVSFSSPDVMRFMGKKVNGKGEKVSRNAHEVVSDCTAGGRADQAPVGKELHQTLRQSLYRHKTGDEEGPMQWRHLRAGIADLHRRTEVSQKALDHCFWPSPAECPSVRANGDLAAAYEAGRIKSSRDKEKSESSNTEQHSRNQRKAL